MFFGLLPKTAILSDRNEELIVTYQVIRDRVEDLIMRLAAVPISKDVHSSMRNAQPNDPMDRAVRCLYLNRTSFNGLYRVNRKGQFNVPFGCKPGTVVCDAEHLRSLSSALRVASLNSCDFEEAVGDVGWGDLVYFDPPYTVKHDCNGFRRYNEAIFSWADQERLARVARQLATQGAHVIISNAHHPDILELYSDCFLYTVVSRQSLISGKPGGRTTVKEIILTNYRKC